MPKTPTQAHALAKGLDIVFLFGRSKGFFGMIDSNRVSGTTAMARRRRCLAGDWSGL